MTVNTPEPSTDLTEEEKRRAIEQGEAWVEDYWHQVPSSDLYSALTEHALAQLNLALGPRYGKMAAANILALISVVPEPGKNDEIRKRIEDGDISLLHDHDADLEFLWSDIDAELAHLFAYARYGYGRHIDPAASRAEIEGLIVHFRSVVADSGMRAAGGKYFEWLADTLAAAEARWAIDHGKSVMPDGLAALAGVKLKTIANLLAARDLPSDAEGQIPAAEALRYLVRREGFIRSNWQFPAEQSAATPETESSEMTDQVFVPVDSDGNPFLPSTARRGRDGVPRYAIGAKSDPEYVEDYWEALDRLSRMPTPRWRRPPTSGKGGWSLVTAREGWRRFPRTDLDKMVEAIRTESTEARS
jgi:hypothetical protein